MYRDSRGGHNRKAINENFFKIWSPQMAYILGLIFADGAIEDVRKSSRTCYISITSNDKSLLGQVLKAMNSKHIIISREPRVITFKEKAYLCAKTFNLRIGNKTMFQDLINRGVRPRKSLTMKFPEIPFQFFSFFLRGYFDGDGCLNIYIPKGQKAKRIKVIFTSGSCKFLSSLSEKLHSLIKTSLKRIYKSDGAFQLSYRKADSIKILSSMYKNLENAPYLVRKYKIFQRI